MVTLAPPLRRFRASLGARLFLLYLAAGGIPIVLAAAAGMLLLRQQSRVQDLPAVENILEASLRGHRRGLDRVERALENRGSDLVEQLGTGTDLAGPGARAVLATARTPGIDVAALFVLRPDGWTRVHWEDPLGAPPPESSPVPPAPAPSPQGPPRSQLLRYRGVDGDIALVPTYLWGTARDSTVAPELRGCLLLGSRFAPGFFDDLESASEGLVLYRRLQDLVRLTRVTDAVVLGSALLISLAVGLLLARRLARGITHPVDELVQGMSALGVGREVAASTPSTIPEMEILREAFERMRRTLREYEVQLRDREQLKGAQQTARYVAHEIRNALTPVQAGLAVLARRLAELPEASRPQGERALEGIRHEAERMAALAGAFSEYAQLPEAKTESLRIETLLADLLARDLPAGVEAIADIQPELPSVEADRDDVERLLRNLLKNAVEAMNGTGRLWVSARQDADTGAVVVVIRDEGCGMDERTLQQIYHPGFTTKSTGTGLGLPLVRRSMLRYGGRIEVQSAVGAGTTVTLRFPGAVQRGSS